MVDTIIGKKVGMTQIFKQDGSVVPATIVAVESAVVSKHIQAGETVSHVEIGFGKQKKSNKADIGNYAKLGYVPMHKYSIKAGAGELPEVGQSVTTETFSLGDKVDVKAVTKGKGFQGVVKRHGFSGGKKTHGGESGKLRSPGSIAAGQTLGRVYKGKKMGGHMGAVNRTTKNLRIVELNPESNLIVVGGAVPGSKGCYVVITKAKY